MYGSISKRRAKSARACHETRSGHDEAAASFRSGGGYGQTSSRFSVRNSPWNDRDTSVNRMRNPPCSTAQERSRKTRKLKSSKRRDTPDPRTKKGRPIGPPLSEQLLAITDRRDEPLRAWRVAPAGLVASITSAPSRIVHTTSTPTFQPRVWDRMPELPRRDARPRVPSTSP